MKWIHAPWRATYLMGGEQMKGCLFCDVFRDDDDRKNLVLARAGHWYLIINRYPYTTGHIMAVTNRHVATFAELEPDEGRELTEILARSERAIQSAYAPDGINMGANLGRSAGAGIVGHLHVHLVPRWQGDTNFMSVVGETRVVSEDLNDTYDRIRRALDES